jgi:23S rRNA (guanosine2251-2'-O)-methyltransferase
VAALLERAPGRVVALYLQAGRDDARLQGLVARAEAAALPVQRLSRAELDARFPGWHHQGAVAQCRPATVASEADLPGLLAVTAGAPLLLVLDGVQDPHNLGACLRTADAAGVTAVIAPRDRAVGLTPTVRKVACGAAETLPFLSVTNLARTLRQLRDAGLWIVGAAGEGSTDLYRSDLSGPLALVLGAEERGLRRLTREHCDFLVRIPMFGSVASLNVSVAAGICLFEAVRQRAQAQIAPEAAID